MAGGILGDKFCGLFEPPVPSFAAQRIRNLIYFLKNRYQLGDPHGANIDQPAGKGQSVAG